jgi:hypothetical protein
MSDNESVSSASSAEPVTIAEMLAEARDHQKKADELLKQAEKLAKKTKVKTPKAAGEKKPRKTSEGQRRWQAFQKFVWDQLKEENPAAPYKEAMQAAGPRWSSGEAVSQEDKDAFEAWLEENPIPTEEERAAAKEEKTSATKAARDAKKAEKKTPAAAKKAPAAKKAAAAAAAATTDAETSAASASEAEPTPKKAAAAAAKAAGLPTATKKTVPKKAAKASA